MKRILAIAWKDLLVIFRDRTALILMLAAPFFLTLGMGVVTGSFSGNQSSGIRDIPVVIVNQDGEGQIATALIDVFQSADLDELLNPTLMADEAAARALVDNDETAAVIIIPAGFSQAIMPSQESTSNFVGGTNQEVVQLELYTNPGRPISNQVIQAVITEFLNRVDTSIMGMQVGMTQLFLAEAITAETAEAVGQQVGQKLFNTENPPSIVQLKSSTAGQSSESGFNPLGRLAPAMAILFLMYTVSAGGRTLLTEKEEGTLNRILTTPTTMSQVIAGKMVGTFLSGVAQMMILIVACTVLFGLEWGDWLGVVLLVVTVCLAATAWGMLITSLAKTAGQVGAFGSAAMLLFGILGGSFMPVNFHPVLNVVSSLTPNRWAIDGFALLALGQNWIDILPSAGALLAMSAVVFTAAVLSFRQRWLA